MTTANKGNRLTAFTEEFLREEAFDKTNALTPEKAHGPAKDQAHAPVPAAAEVPPVAVPVAMVAGEVKKPERGRGRPKTKPASRLASFHLPVELIDRLDAEAAKTTAGNKSLFIVQLLENYFSNK